MTYKVVPFTAKIGNTDSASAAAAQLESVISAHAAEGWDYVRLEQVDTYVAGSNGCFGFGAVPGRSISIAMVVFRR
jgi:hypothetical protein